MINKRVGQEICKSSAFTPLLSSLNLTLCSLTAAIIIVWEVWFTGNRTVTFKAFLCGLKGHTQDESL